MQISKGRKRKASKSPTKAQGDQDILDQTELTRNSIIGSSLQIRKNSSVKYTSQIGKGRPPK